MKPLTTRYPTKILGLAIALAVALPLAVSAGNGLRKTEGMVYTLSNAAAGNRVVTFERMSDGSLDPRRSFGTGGAGTGAGLGNQGALALSDSGHWLLAVNPGSDTVSVFLAFGNFLLRTDVEDSGGAQPISVAVKDDVVYVLNAGSDSLQGFRLNIYGRLTPIDGSARLLSDTGTGPAQVEFNRAGDLLAVTEKGTNRVLTWPVDGDGLLGDVTITDSPAPTPFGFAFGRRDQMFVSEADGGNPGASTMSSYQLGGDGAANVISAALPSGQTAACWVAVTRAGDFAYVTNTQSDNVSVYAIAEDGSLSLDDASAGLTGDTPIDVALDRNDRYLYTLNAGSGTISVFAVGSDGSLQPIEDQASGQLGAGTTGLVAR